MANPEEITLIQIAAELARKLGFEDAMSVRAILVLANVHQLSLADAARRYFIDSLLPHK